MVMDDNDRNEDEKDSELDILAQQELLRLTRQYRVGWPPLVAKKLQKSICY